MKMQVNQFTLPPDAILIRRMHGVVAIVLGQLRAGADWGAIAAEYLHGEAPATALGRPRPISSRAAVAGQEPLPGALSRGSATVRDRHAVRSPVNAAPTLPVVAGDPARQAEERAGDRDGRPHRYSHA